MTERERWIYALPPREAATHLRKTFEGHGFAACEEENEGAVVRFVDSPESASFVVLDRPDLEVTLVEAQGNGAVGALGALLKETGFFAQSALLSSAFDVGTCDAKEALLTLAHMVVAWDDDWADLFLLHLAAPDPVVRHDAVTALTVAAMVARDRGPALELLAEAAQRETFPKLKGTIDEAKKVVEAIAPPA